MPISYRLASPRSLAPTAPWIFPDGANAYDTGRRALRAGFLEPARSIFGALAGWESGHPEIALSLAETEVAAGNPGKAGEWLSSVESDLRHNAAFLSMRADVELSQGRISRALPLAFLASELSPADPVPRFLMARLQWMGGQEHEAELAFLSLAGEPDVGDRAVAWAVLCGWRRGETGEVSELFASLRDDDVVCEALRQLGREGMGLEWTPSPRVEASTRDALSATWGRRLFRERPRHGMA